MDTPAGPHVVRAGEGATTGEPGFLDRYLLESATSSGRVALVEHVLGPKMLAAPMHRHSREDEYSYVLTGTLGVIEEGVEITATAGDLISKPRGRWHTFWNAGDDELCVLEIIVPEALRRCSAGLPSLAANTLPRRCQPSRRSTAPRLTSRRQCRLWNATGFCSKAGEVYMTKGRWNE